MQGLTAIGRKSLFRLKPPRRNNGATDGGLHGTRINGPACVPSVRFDARERACAGRIEEHPGGQFTITRDGRKVATFDATNLFRLTLRGTKWDRRVRGFHTLGHWFASNAACSGVDPGMIDAWMGHQTLEMRERYRHLFPKQQQTAIDLIFSRRAG